MARAKLDSEQIALLWAIAGALLITSPVLALPLILPPPGPAYELRADAAGETYILDSGLTEEDCEAALTNPPADGPRVPRRALYCLASD